MLIDIIDLYIRVSTYVLIQLFLLYDKHTGNVIGYTNLGEVNNHLLAFERSIKSNTTHPLDPAKFMLVFIVKSLFTDLKYP